MEQQTARLARKSNADTIKVEDLLLRVQGGGLRVPLFQRPLRWRSNHVRDLFDSIYHAMPVGVLLFAEEPRAAERVRLGPLTIEAPPVSDTWLVVDGQQRVVALAGALLHPDPEPRSDIHAIWFDLETERFERRTKTDIPPTWIPLNVVGDSAKLLSWLNRWPAAQERGDLVQRAIALSKAIREYDIPCYVVPGADESALRLIFKRINTAGFAMRDSEVFHALHGNADESPQVACQRLASTGFGVLSPEVFVRCLQAVEALPLRGGVAETDTVHPGSIHRTEVALERALHFLMVDAGIPHSQLLPYRLPLIVLAKLFHDHAALSQRNLLRLRWWLWRGALSGEHSNVNQPSVRRHLKAIAADESDAVTALLSMVSSSPPPVNLAATPTTRSAAANLTAVALLAMQPIRPDTDVVWDDDELRSYLNGDGRAPADGEDAAGQHGRTLGQVYRDAFQRNDAPLCARLLCPSGSVLHRLAAWPDRVLASHQITGEMVAAWSERDAQHFDLLRGEALSPFVEPFFAERAGIGENDRPPIDSIIARVNGHA